MNLGITNVDPKISARILVLQCGSLGNSIRLWIEVSILEFRWILGLQSEFWYFSVDLWISIWILGFQYKSCDVMV